MTQGIDPKRLAVEKFDYPSPGYLLREGPFVAAYVPSSLLASLTWGLEGGEVHAIVRYWKQGTDNSMDEGRPTLEDMAGRLAGMVRSAKEARPAYVAFGGSRARWRDYDDDLVVVGQDASLPDCWFGFWFDRDVSDCVIARFSTKDEVLAWLDGASEEYGGHLLVPGVSPLDIEWQ